jgi:protein-disulfide isomerase
MKVMISMRLDQHFRVRRHDMIRSSGSEKFLNAIHGFRLGDSIDGNAEDVDSVQHRVSLSVNPTHNGTIVRTNRLIIVSGTLVLLAACSMETPVSVRQPTETGSVTSTAAPGTGDTVGANEAMPKNTDSLEAGAGTGAPIPVSLSERFTLLSGSGMSIPTLTEYFDYDCDYCREFALRQQPWIDREFIATKRMNMERVFAPQTPLGFRLAQGEICAGLEGKVGEMDQALIALQPKNDAEILATAKKLGLKTQSFTSCMQRNDLLPKKDDGGIKRVPTFALGSEQWQGILPEEEMRAKIEELLKKK